jgi:hypothetical protein
MGPAIECEDEPDEGQVPTEFPREPMNEPRTTGARGTTLHQQPARVSSSEAPTIGKLSDPLAHPTQIGQPKGSASGGKRAFRSVETKVREEFGLDLNLHPPRLVTERRRRRELGRHVEAESGLSDVV